MIEQTQCPNCRGYKVYSQTKRRFVTKTEYISAREYRASRNWGCLIGVLIVDLALIVLTALMFMYPTLSSSSTICVIIIVIIIVAWFTIGLAWEFFRLLYVNANGGTIKKTTVQEVVIHYGCQICGYQWELERGKQPPKKIGSV